MTSKPKKVLVAPLDWGLGHATRCIPIIKLLLSKGHHVSIASSGNALALLRLEFDELEWFALPSYGATYSKHVPFMINVLLQLPKFLLAIAREKKEIEKLALDNQLDLIISDNRYGCRHKEVNSIFICHQLNIMMPQGLKWFSPVVNYFNHRWIQLFNKSWIPDDSYHSLTGKLSEPRLKNSIHIGILSRFVRQEPYIVGNQLTIILSGPEPQRSIFETIIMTQVRKLDIECVVVRGVLGGSDKITADGKIKVYNYLGEIQLQQLINESSLIICRSGYSSIMDLATIGKRAIFVPTPGQTEQEYLGQIIMKKNIAPCYPQKEFNLQLALDDVKSYAGFEGVESQPNLLERAIESELK